MAPTATPELFSKEQFVTVGNEELLRLTPSESQSFTVQPVMVMFALLRSMASFVLPAYRTSNPASELASELFRK